MTKNVNVKAIRPSSLLGLVAVPVAWVLVSAFPQVASAQQVARVPPVRVLALKDIHMETIQIQGDQQTWTIEKVCIDGQQYLLIPGTGGPPSIAPAFAIGHPAQCRNRKPS